MWLSISLGDLDRPPVEVETGQRRLAPLPGDGDFRTRGCGEEIAEVRVQRLVGHPEAVARVERLLCGRFLIACAGRIFKIWPEIVIYAILGNPQFSLQ